jgi:hypothetical protein
MSRIAPIDWEVLARIFFPGQPIASVKGCFFFGKKPRLAGHVCLSFGYVNNPDGSIRWLYPLGSGQPVFLRLYNGAGWRGRWLRLAFRTAFLLRNGWLLRSGRLHVFYKNQPPPEWLPAHCPQGNMAIFTGTVGENRKAVAVLEESSGQRWFLKLPLTAAATGLVKHEVAILAELSKLGLKKMQVPNARPLAAGLLVSDVKPLRARYEIDLQTLHYEAVIELSERTLEQVRLEHLPCWAAINVSLEALQYQPDTNGLPPSKIQRIVANLLALRSAIQPETTVPTSLAHGDFTPWNLYLGPGRLHVYDWELSERLPLLNDVFHFIFQTGVLVKKQPYPDIEPAIFSIKKNAQIQALLRGSDIDLEWLYLFYLLRNTSYYLLKYLRQQPLHQQAHWLVEAWDLALVEAVKNLSQTAHVFQG